MGDRLTEEDSGAEPKSYGDIFDEAFPHYLVMGMTPEQYWDGESWLKKAYREAYRIRMENEERIRDSQAWLQGVYIREALQSIALIVNGFVPRGASPQPYPSKPRLEEAEEQKRAEKIQKKEDNQMQTQIALFQAMADKFNKNLRKRKEQEEKQKHMEP